jgi:ribosomal protein S18 acetylase RimI-like enzyme
MGMSVTISTATESDAERILKLQYLSYQSEAELYGDWGIDPLTETLADLRARLAQRRTLVARLGEEVVGAVSGWVDADGIGHIERLCVHPRLQRHGLGGRLVRGIEEALAATGSELRAYRLATGHRSLGNLRLYQRLGYDQMGTEQVSPRLSFVVLEKPVLADVAAARLAASA